MDRVTKPTKDGYQLSAAGRAFLEALIRRKRIRGEEIPPIYLDLPAGAGTHPAPHPQGLAVPEVFPSAGSATPAPPSVATTVLVDQALEAHPVEGISATARRAYRLLLALGVELLARKLNRALPKNISQVTAFVVNRLLAFALGVSEVTLYRALQELEEAGLIRRAAWQTPAVVHGRAGIYAAGTVYAVRLPHRARKPRLEPHDVSHPWRDLEGDIARGKTAWRLVKECKDNPPKGDLEVLGFLLGALSPPEGQKAALDIHSFTHLRQAKAGDRRRLVAEIALGLAKEFRDPGSVRFYAWVLWGALRAEIYGFHPRALEVVVWAIRRVREAVATSLWSGRGSIRRPGALLAYLLQQQGLLSLLRSAPSWRVA